MNNNLDKEYSYYRHCEGGVGGIGDAENHWKCSGDGDDGPCGCLCHLKD